jgi:hypothetical protein
VIVCLLFISFDSFDLLLNFLTRLRFFFFIVGSLVYQCSFNFKPTTVSFQIQFRSASSGSINGQRTIGRSVAGRTVFESASDFVEWSYNHF